MECRQCGKEFEGRSDARYCSAKCRVTANRAKAESVTDKKAGPTCFEDLPADVQRTIESMASSPEDKQVRTERALRYQMMFPSLYSKGIDLSPIGLPTNYKIADQLKPGEHNSVSKPGDLDYPQDKGQCHTCGAQTQIKAITKCHNCIDSKELVSA